MGQALRVGVVCGLLLLVPTLTGARRLTDDLRAHLDLPAAGQVLPRHALSLHGWAFNCTRGGAHPFSARVQLLGAGQILNVDVVRYAPIARPDVQAAFASSCAGMSAYTGFVLVPRDWTQLPTGTWTVAVEHADSFGAVYTQRMVTLVD